MDDWTKFAEALFRVNGLMIAAGETITAEIGQSSARWQVLGGLGYGPRTVADLARQFGHARQSVQRVADVLRAEGLIAQAEKPGDRRTFLLSLTPKGTAVLHAIYARQVAWSERLMQQLPTEDLPRLAEALHGIGDAIAANLKTGGDAPQE